MLKKNDLHESIRQPVVNSDKNHDRPGRPDVKRDTRHELRQGPVGRRSSNARQLGLSRHEAAEFYFTEELRHAETIQRVKFTKAIARHTKIRDQNLRSDVFAQVNLISAAPMLQNLRIVHSKRQSGKS